MSVTITTLDRKQGRKKVLQLVEAQIEHEYPNLDRKQKRKLVKLAAAEAIKQAHGLRIQVKHQPANWWESLKDKIAPSWFTNHFPVRYIEVWND